MHPEALFAGKVAEIGAGATRHPLYNPEGWSKMIAEGEANFRKRVQDEAAKAR